MIEPVSTNLRDELAQTRRACAKPHHLRRISQHLLVPVVQLGKAKVEQLRAVARQHDVGGLQVSVDNAVAMRVVQRTGNPNGGAQSSMLMVNASGTAVKLS